MFECGRNRALSFHESRQAKVRQMWFAFCI